MLDDRILAMLELSGDMFFHKIPKERCAYYIDAALDAGEQLEEKFAGLDIHSLYREFGIHIEYKERSGASYGVLLRGQIELSASSSVVLLYRESLEALARYSAWGETPALSVDAAEKAHLAHEFFHFLEYDSKAPVAESLEPVVTAKLGRFSRKAHIQKCGEIAAHAFARRLLGLPALPNLYDYLYLIGTSKLTMEAFSKRCDELEALLNG